MDCEKFQDTLDLLNEQEIQVKIGERFDPNFFKIYKIMSLYTTFILEEAVHPPETPFPGGREKSVKSKIYRFLEPQKIFNFLEVLKLNMNMEFIYALLKKIKRIILVLYVVFALQSRMKSYYNFKI